MPELRPLERLVEKLGLQSNVKMLGYVTNLQDYQHIVDVCVSCSRREGLPLNIVEAMLSGTPVVATRNRGHKELVSDQESGFIVDCWNQQLLRDRVLSLLLDPVLADMIVYGAKKKSALYQAGNIKRELGNIYFSL